MFSIYEIAIVLLIILAFAASLFESSVMGILLSIVLLAIFVEVFWQKS